jgi:protein-disulfide isomerase
MSEQKNSKAPLIIIVAVLIPSLVTVYFLMNRNKTAPAANANKVANTTKTPAVTAVGATPPNMLGSPTATVTIEEFADFQCPTCAVVHPKVKEVLGVYGSRVKFIFRNYPLAIPAHDKAYDAAVATEAAGRQGRFFEMQNLLFTNQQSWSANPDYRKQWEDYAKQLGLDVEQFKTDMAGSMTKSRVDADLQRGRSLNVNSTPSIYVNGQLLALAQMQDVAAFKSVIDAELAKNSPAANSAANSNGAK